MSKYIRIVKATVVRAIVGDRERAIRAKAGERVYEVTDTTARELVAKKKAVVAEAPKNAPSAKAKAKARSRKAARTRQAGASGKAR